MKKINVLVISENYDVISNITVSEKCLIGILEENVHSQNWGDVKLLYSNRDSLDPFDFKWLCALDKTVNVSKKIKIKKVIKYILLNLITIGLIYIFLL